MINRDISKKLRQLSQKFSIISVIGPRQSGKTTLVKNTFPKMKYVNLEEPDTRLYATQDPRDFLISSKNGMIIDEIQKAPELFSYIQSFSDASKKNAQFVLTGSENFLLQEKITQSLAGRVAILTLLPLSLNELSTVQSHPDFDNYLFKGFYPPIYDRRLDPKDWYQSYIHTYIERDVRQIKNIPDLNAFNIFIRLCAGRIGQLLNLSSIANDAGISVNTAKSWLSILEASFIVFRLQPHFNNYNKRLVKSPKLYFYDVGLACSLLGIVSPSQVKTHFQLGALFENLIIAELLKFRFNKGNNSNLFFWRDKLGRELDCLFDDATKKISIEIKAGKTINADFMKGLTFYNTLTKNERTKSFVIYGGSTPQSRSKIKILPWFNAVEVFKK